MDNRVFITGMGAITCAGAGAGSFWRALMESDSGIRPFPRLQETGIPVDLAGHAESFSAKDWIREINFRRLPRFSQLLIAACEMAMDGSGTVPATRQPGRSGLVYNTAFGPVDVTIKFLETLILSGPKACSPLTFAQTVMNAAASPFCVKHSMKGFSTVSSGYSSIIMGYHAIRQGRADFMVCAGAEAFGKNLDIFPTFFHAGMLSSRNAESGEGCRPGDARANGTVLGEASGAIVLESESSARSRGARVLGEVIGTGSSFDDGCVRKIHGRSARPVIVAMRNALAQARLEAASIGYINCFANGTPSVDGPESEAIGSVFGNRLPLCGAYKGITGEVSGSNDTLGSIQAVMTLEHGMAAPVAGLETPSRYCPIPYVLRNPSPIGSPFAMVNSFQVGGGVECLVIGKGEAR